MGGQTQKKQPSPDSRPGPPARRSPLRMNFTKTALTKFSLSSAGRTYIFDSNTPGPVLQVTEKGVRSFYVHPRKIGRS